ncbi:MAG: hypothetical protein AB7N76_17605 [Planctomycetota bacterium]
MKRVLGILGTTAIALVAALGIARASTVLRFAPEDMTDRAAVILHAKVILKQCRHLDRGVIVTDYRLEVRDALKGFRGDIFSFTAYGGVLGDRGGGISGDASFGLGEEVFVFLTPINKLGLRAAVGLAQGKYSIREVKGRKLAFRDLEGLQLMDRGNGKVEEAKPEQGVDFEELVARVKARLETKKAAAKGSERKSEGQGD